MIGDVYQLDMRFEYSGVTLRNTLHYKQLEEGDPGQPGSDLLLDIAELSASGTFHFFIGLMSINSELSCMNAHKVSSATPGTPGDQTLRFYTGKNGGSANTGQPPSSTAVMELVTQQEHNGLRAPVASLYIGALTGEYVNGVFFEETLDTYVKDRQGALILPEDVLANQKFRLVVKSASGVPGEYDYIDVSYVNPPCYPSKRRSRIQNIC